MKTSDTNVVHKADRIASFIEGIGMGLLLAYIISAFSTPLPNAVMYAGLGIIVVAAWIPVLARRKRVDCSNNA